MLQRPTIITSQQQKILIYSAVVDQVPHLAFYNLSQGMLVAQIEKAELFVNSFDEKDTAQTFVQYISGEELVLRKIDFAIDVIQINSKYRNKTSQDYHLYDNEDEIISKSYISVDTEDEDHNVWKNRYDFERRFDWNNYHRRRHVYYKERHPM